MNEVVPEGEALARAVEWGKEIAGFAPLTLRYNKLALDHPGDPAVAAAFEACWSSADLAEGRRARAQRRGPVFTGR